MKYLQNHLRLIAIGTIAVAVIIVAAVVLTRPAASPTVLSASDDAVNKIAAKLYCPVCENIPLDTCGTAACIQWRDEIRLQLEAGKSETQIVDDFVTRFGDRVVGIPQDPMLRTLSLMIPVVVSAGALFTAAFIFVRWRTALVQHGTQSGDLQAAASAVPVTTNKPKTSGEYRARLERDLARRR